MTDRRTDPPAPRKGMPSPRLDRESFERRFRAQFVDPVFGPLEAELGRLAAAAWDAYSHSRKSPMTRRAGPSFADPDYELSVDWLAARDAAVAEAQRRHEDEARPARILLVNGSSRRRAPGPRRRSARSATEVASPRALDCATCAGKLSY